MRVIQPSPAANWPPQSAHLSPLTIFNAGVTGLVRVVAALNRSNCA
jgi:hypothetical protein